MRIMKKRFTNFVLPFGIGLMLFTVTILGFVSTSSTGCTKASSQHCRDNAYPLWCPAVERCCPSGMAWNCDGKCYQSGCPSGTVTASVCARE